MHTRVQGVSNIVFSNGDLDPWSGGGVTRNVTGSPSVVAIVIEQVHCIGTVFGIARTGTNSGLQTRAARGCSC